MLIGGDDISNDVITLGGCFHVFFSVCLHSHSFPLSWVMLLETILNYDF